MKLHKFEVELTRLINKLNIDNDLSTPDFILARMLTGWLDTYAKAKAANAEWHEDEERVVGAMAEKSEVCQPAMAGCTPKPPLENPMEKCVASAGRCTTKTSYGLQCVKAAGHETDHQFEPSSNFANTPGAWCSYVFPDGRRCMLGTGHLGDHVKPFGL